MLWRKMAEDSAIRCCTSTSMDWETVHARFKNEGLSFLTITLPTFGKDFEKSLDLGFLDRRLFTGFRRKGESPLFLKGFLDLVFDRDSGVLVDDPSIDAILCVRQLTLAFGKMYFPCTSRRTRAAMKGYIDCETELKASDKRLSKDLFLDFQRISGMLFGPSFTEIDRKVYYHELVPKHGPGATADRLRGNAKFDQRTWTVRLEEGYFPYGEYALPNWSFYDQLDAVEFREPRDEIPVRVISVPKTLKTPRIIGIEPTCMQYTQQALSTTINDVLDGNFLLSRLVGNRDQTPNQRLARIGSISGSLATLDLSEASDRVSNQLVRGMLHNHPHLLKAVDACRSRKADVPGYGIQRIAKFASMGSALCFPFEAMVFCTIIFLGIERELRTPLSPRDFYSFLDQVRVYGDDIIIPVEYVQSVVSILETFGFRVNAGKSFWTGRFRESCGRDYYNGFDVSYIKVRHVFPTQRKHVTEIISLVSLRNQLYFSGFWGTVRWLDKEVVKLLSHFPTTLPTSPVLGRHSFLGYFSERTCPRLHRPLVKGFVVKATPPISRLDGTGALLKWFLSSAQREDLVDGLMPIPKNSPVLVDKKHLERAGRDPAVNIKLGWHSAT